MSKESRKGNAFAEIIARYSSVRLGDGRIERRVLHGTKDRGDIAGLLHRGRRVVMEVKCCKEMRLAKWSDETEIERLNDDAEYGVIAVKRRGCGLKNIGKTYVVMDLDTFLAMLAGGREFLYDWIDE